MSKEQNLRRAADDSRNHDCIYSELMEQGADEIKRLKETERALVQAASACVHYQEFIDTGEAMDLHAAKSIMSWDPLRKWLADNAVLVPWRRDDKTVAQAVRL